MNPSDFSSGFLSDFTLCAYTGRFSGCGSTNQMRSLLFQQLLSQHPIPHTPEGSSVLLFQGLDTFLGLRLCVAGSAPSCTHLWANLSTLQDSLYVTGCWFALLSQEVTSLQHNQSPGRTGCLLPGRLSVTRIGLPPISSC